MPEKPVKRRLRFLRSRIFREKIFGRIAFRFRPVPNPDRPAWGLKSGVPR
jgi:hypothetical protein